MKAGLLKAGKIVIGVVLGGIIGNVVDKGVDKTVEFVTKKKEKAHN